MANALTTPPCQTPFFAPVQKVQMLEQGQSLTASPFHLHAYPTWVNGHTTSGPPTSHCLYPGINDVQHRYNIPQGMEKPMAHIHPPYHLQQVIFQDQIDCANAGYSLSSPRTRLHMTCTGMTPNEGFPYESREISLNASEATSSGENAFSINVNDPEAHRRHSLIQARRVPECLPVARRRHDSQSGILWQTMTSTNTSFYTLRSPDIPECALNLMALRRVDPSTNQPTPHVFDSGAEAIKQTGHEISPSLPPSLNLSSVSSSWLPSHLSPFNPTTFDVHTQHRISLQPVHNVDAKSLPSQICDSGSEPKDEAPDRSSKSTNMTTQPNSVSSAESVQLAQVNHIPNFYHDQTSSSPAAHLEPTTITHPSDKVSISSAKLRNAYRSPSAATRSGSKRKKKSKMHECDICHKFFPRPSGLATHQNSHLGLKPYQCEFPTCPRFFAVRSNAKRHLRTHGINLPQCEETTTPYTVGFITPVVLPEHPSSNMPMKLRWVASLMSPADSVQKDVERTQSLQEYGAAIWQCVVPPAHLSQDETGKVKDPNMEINSTWRHLPHAAIVLRPVSL